MLRLVVLFPLQTLNLLGEDALLLLHGELLLLAQRSLGRLLAARSRAPTVRHRGARPGAERRRRRVGTALPNATFALKVCTQTTTKQNTRFLIRRIRETHWRLSKNTRLDVHNVQMC